jgi:hypothetical protein
MCIQNKPIVTSLASARRLRGRQQGGAMNRQVILAIVVFAIATILGYLAGEFFL